MPAVIWSWKCGSTMKNKAPMSKRFQIG